MNFGPVVSSAGPCPARIAIVAEAPGDVESEQLRPLVGPSGWELRRMLKTIGVNLDDCYKTNVFSRQPSANNIALYGTATPTPECRALGPLSTNPITYLDSQWLGELDRLRDELSHCNPNIIIALGNVASWALIGQQGISSLRGSVHRSSFLPSRVTKVLPTYHPAYILRQWDQRVIALADLEKAHNESFSPAFAYDNSELWLNPTLEDLYTFGRLHLENATVCSTDVETKRGQITCVSFAPRPDISIAVPFWLEGDNLNYWTESEEFKAWRWVQRWIEKPDLTLVMQNGMFDTQYFTRHGLKVLAFTEDTMLQHHSLYSELQKGLGFLGSVYANYPTWKNLRTFKQEDLLKRDD